MPAKLLFWSYFYYISMNQHYEKKLLKYKLDLWPANFF